MATVLQPDHSQKIFIPEETGKETYFATGLEAAQPQETYAEANPDPREHLSDVNTEGKKRKRKWILIGCSVALLLIIIAAVVGGVLGSRRTNASEGGVGDGSRQQVSRQIILHFADGGKPY
jgi:hypothetical protein